MDGFGLLVLMMGVASADFLYGTVDALRELGDCFRHVYVYCLEEIWNGVASPRAVVWAEWRSGIEFQVDQPEVQDAPVRYGVCSNVREESDSFLRESSCKAKVIW